MKKLEFNNHKNAIFRQLKIYRAKEDITQSELAARLQSMDVHIDQQMISKIENDTRIVTDYELACLCRALGVKLEDMLLDYYLLMQDYEENKE